MSKPAFIGPATGLPWATRDGEVWDGTSYHRFGVYSATSPWIKEYFPGKESGNVDVSIAADDEGDIYYYKPAVGYNTYYPVSMSLYEICKCACRVKIWTATFTSTFTPHTGSPVTNSNTTDLPIRFSQPHQNATPDENYLPDNIGCFQTDPSDNYTIGIFGGGTSLGTGLSNDYDDSGPPYVKVGDLYYPRLLIYDFREHSINASNQKTKYVTTGYPDEYVGGDSVNAGYSSVTWTHSYDPATTKFTVTLSAIYTNGDDYEASWEIAPTEWWGYGGRFDTGTADYLGF